MSGGIEDNAKMLPLLPCPNCGKQLNNSELVGMLFSVPVPLCSECKKKVSAKPRDMVNHPKHYTSNPSGIECIDVTRHMNFNLGNTIKYIWRAGKKEDALVDLKKAQWYLSDEINRLEKERNR